MVRSAVSARISVRRSSPNSSLSVEQLVLDDAHQPLLGGEDALEVGDEGQGLLVLLDDLVALELGQALQPHVEDGLAWISDSSRLPHQGVLGGLGVLRLRG